MTIDKACCGNVVIFGGSGFIGSHLTAALLRQGTGIIYLAEIKPVER